MLTDTVDRAAVSRSLAVCIDVGSVVVRLALTHVSEDCGWRVCLQHQASCRGLVVADRQFSSCGGRLDVLVSRDDPASCQEAVDAVLEGRARAVVIWDEPEALPTTVDAVQRGSAVLPQRVITLAHAAPRLTDRQRRTLRLIAAGRSNTQIATGLHQSVSTSKRDIAELLERFDVTNRAALMNTATRLGFLQGPVT